MRRHGYADRVSVEGLFTILGNLAIALSFVVALMFGIVQVRAATRDRRERLTLEALRSFQTREFAANLQYIRSHEPPQTAKAFNELPAEDQTSFIHFAQELEMLGLLVADGAIELDLVERTLGDFVAFVWERYRPLLLDMRRDNNDPFLAEYLQWLAEQVGTMMRDKPRVPAYLSS
jgi:hypothetical protein